MQDKSSYLLAADSEVEMEEWITILNKILQLNFEAAMQEKRNGDSHEGRLPPGTYTLCGCLYFCQVGIGRRLVLHKYMRGGMDRSSSQIACPQRFCHIITYFPDILYVEIM